MPVFSMQRRLFAGGVLLCAALVGTALYFQHVKGIEPCPLCIFQRLTVIALGVVLLVAAIHDPGAVARRVYGALIALVAGTGVGIAARHVWLQSLPPDQVPECGPGLEYMLKAFPLGEALSMVLSGSGECAEVQWRLLGIAIPGWNLLFFSLATLAGLWLLFVRARR